MQLTGPKGDKRCDSNCCELVCPRVLLCQVQDNGHYGVRPAGNGNNQHASELQSLHRTVTQLEERCTLLENIAQDAQNRLEVRALSYGMAERSLGAIEA